MATHGKKINAKDKGASSAMKKIMEHKMSRKAGNGYQQVAPKKTNKGSRV